MVQRDLEPGADAARILQILGGRAVAVVIFPVGHVQGLDVGARVFQQERGNGRIHPAGQAEDDLAVRDVGEVVRHSGAFYQRSRSKTGSSDQVSACQYGVDVVLQRQHAGEQRLRLPAPRLEVLDTARDQR